MASVLIMAQDLHGAIRFVGEVPRGAACGCFCPVCKSPLVAKQGSENEWHFSHEAAQERPECKAGEENLARALGIEFAQDLAQRGAFVLPDYTTSVAPSSAWLQRSREVRWSAQISYPLLWRDRPPKSQPVATGMLDTGAHFALFVQVGAEESPQIENLPTDCAYGALVVMPSWPAGTRTREAAMTALQHTASFRWRYHPDTLGLVAQAQADIEAQERAVRQRAEAVQRERADAAGKRWAAIKNRMDHGQLAPSWAHADLHQPHPSQPLSAEVATSALRFPSYPGHRPGCNFQFYRLGPDEAWVFYPLDTAFIRDNLTMSNPELPPPTKLWAIAPAGGRDEGWDECLPSYVGVADVDHGIYWVRDPMAVTFLSSRSRKTAMDQDPTAFVDL